MAFLAPAVVLHRAAPPKRAPAAEPAPPPADTTPTQTAPTPDPESRPAPPTPPPRSQPPSPSPSPSPSLSPSPSPPPPPARTRPRPRRPRPDVAETRSQAEFYAKLGDVHREDRDYDAAIASYQRALRLDPDNFAAISGRERARVLRSLDTP